MVVVGARGCFLVLVVCLLRFFAVCDTFYFILSFFCRLVEAEESYVLWREVSGEGIVIVSGV